MAISLIPSNLVNQIAAGEVLERPSAAVKELVENALDAEATSIEVIAYDGGRSMIAVTDNGRGIAKEELSLALERHATSKLPDLNLENIKFFGFRGEALPSIAAVARLSITSKTENAENAWKIETNAGNKGEVIPATFTKGTKVEVKDIFFATPARLKFLKSATSEMGQIEDCIKHIAMAHPDVSFTLYNEKQKKLDFPAVHTLDGEDPFSVRCMNVLGKALEGNYVNINAEYNGVRLSGIASLPTFARANSTQQYLFVNGRPVKDKLITGAIRGAYQGLLASGRFPVVVLFLTISPYDVDVNVHPAKIEVRFKDSYLVRSLIVSAIREALSSAGTRISSTMTSDTLSAITTPLGQASQSNLRPPVGNNYGNSFAFNSRFGKKNSSVGLFEALESQAPLEILGEAQNFTNENKNLENEIIPCNELPPLGLAKAQLHKTYIVAQTKDGIVIVDQHAAHERLTYEKIRANLKEESQLLLSPEVVNLTSSEISCLLPFIDELAKVGLVSEPFGDGAILVRAVPAVLDEVNVQDLMKDIIDTIVDFAGTLSLEDKIKEIYAKMACHTSVRAGRILNIEEMNAMLRQMEETPNSAECIHGRPTYVELKLKDVERLFGRR